MVLGPNMEVGKTCSCLGMIYTCEIRWFPATHMDFMLSRWPLGMPVSPETHQETGLQGFSQLLENWAGFPWAPLYIPYLPFVPIGPTGIQGVGGMAEGLLYNHPFPWVNWDSTKLETLFRNSKCLRGANFEPGPKWGLGKNCSLRTNCSPGCAHKALGLGPQGPRPIKAWAHTVWGLGPGAQAHKGPGHMGPNGPCLGYQAWPRLLG